MNEIKIPVSLIGASTQAAEADGASLDILPLPDEMQTFGMPEIELSENLSEGSQALLTLRRLQAELWRQAGGSGVLSEPMEISGLNDEERELIDPLLGEGEVSMLYRGHQCTARIQASVLAGVWWIQYFDQDDHLTSDTLEVAAVPRLCRRHVFTRAAHRVAMSRESIPEGVLNVPPLLAEINDKVAEYRPGHKPHVINLTQLLQSEEDVAFLMQRLGEGPLTILSRGYGNCRVTSTAVEQVWWVQYFNSQERSILNSIEIGDVPAVAAAAPEAISDSAQRLKEILEISL
jgi:hydrogenase-1 operon protein HyaF